MPGVLMATKAPPACPQKFGTVFPRKAADIFTPIQETSEDCLYLNIWAPKSVVDNLYSSNAMGGVLKPGSSVFSSSLSPLAVMTWIHGGSFESGSSVLPMHNGSVLAAYNNVLVVTIQYRLGALGFLQLENDRIPGNLGLLDQIEALKWIQSNIGAFGGNKERVTLFGSDAGAASVTYHMLSPLSKGLFQKAILQSGSSNSPLWFLPKEDAVQRGQSFVDMVSAENCPRARTNDEKFECLQDLDPLTIVKYQNNVLQPDDEGNYGYFQFTFVPIEDGEVVTEPPRNTVEMGRMNTDIPVLLGTVKNEGSLGMILSNQAIEKFPTPIDPNKQTDGLDTNQYSKFISHYFAFYPRNGNKYRTADMLRRFIEMHYSCNSESLSGDDILQKLTEATGDAFIGCPVWGWAEAQSEIQENIYMYQFTHRPSSVFFS